MRRSMAVLLAALACTLLGAPALALDQPEGSARDGRIKVVDYDESNVVAVDVSVTSATQLSFSPGEEVLDLASGFSQGWEFVNRRNHLYLKARSVRGVDGAAVSPAAGKWNTNLIVTTTARVYTFQLNARAERPDKTLGYDPNIAFRVEFRYPAEAARKARQEEAARAAKQRAQRRVAPRNWQYTMQVGPDSDAIVPNMAYDDGLFTFLRFPRTAEFPSAFVEVAGQESIVNTHVDPAAPGILVIHRVAERFNLRLGDQVVAVFNEAFDRRSHDVAPTGPSGTSVPGMRRTVRQADDTTTKGGRTP